METIHIGCINEKHNHSSFQRMRIEIKFRGKEYKILYCENCVHMFGRLPLNLYGSTSILMDYIFNHSGIFFPKNIGERKNLPDHYFRVDNIEWCKPTHHRKLNEEFLNRTDCDLVYYDGYNNFFVYNK